MSVLIKAYINGNVGDDLMLITLCERYLSEKFIVTGSRIYANTFKDCKNLIYIKNDTLFHRFVTFIYRRICNKSYLTYAEYLLRKKYKAIVVVGGSMYIENKNTNKMIIDEMWLKRGAFVLGFNFGPYVTEDFLHFYEKAFCYSKGLTTRDSNTYRLFSDYCRISMASDLVLSHKSRWMSTIGNEVIISVVAEKCLPCTKEYYIELIIHFIKEARERNLSPVLTSFCRAEGDEEMIFNIQKNLKEATNVLFYTGDNITIMENRIAKANCVIATRFHSMILSFVYHKKCLPLIYSSKMENVLSDAGFKGVTIDLKKETDYKSLVNDFYDNPYLDIDEEYITQSYQQFMYLDELLAN